MADAHIIKTMEGTMRKMVLMGVAGLFLLFLAASPVLAAEASIKIGLVDLFKAVNESEKGKAIEKLKGELDKQAGVLSADAKKGKEDEMERLTREYQRTVADSQSEVRKKEG